MLIILALPFHYSLRASWLNQRGELEWSLRWAWFLSLDKIIKGMMAKPEAETAESETDKPIKQRKKETRAKGGSSVASTPRTADGLDSKNETVAEAESNTVKTPTASKPETASDSSPKTKRVSLAENEHSEAEATSTEKRSGSSVWQRFQSARATLAEFWCFRPWLSDWLGRLWRLFHFTPLQLWIAAGWGDPYQTFETFRLVYALRPFLPQGLHLVTEPDFLQLRLDAKLELSGWFSPLQAICTVLRLLIDPTARKLYRKLRLLQLGVE